jgi:hypothetical protein
MTASSRWPLAAALAAILAAACAGAESAWAADIAAADEQLAKLVEQLNADDAAARDEAERSIVELATKGSVEQGEALVDRLPKPNDRMPQEVQTRLARITSEVRRRLAGRGVEATRITLDVKEAPLADVLADIEKQTGNRLTDHREQFGQEQVPKLVTLKAEDQPFWSVLDKILDQTQMSPYSFSGEEGLALVNREPGALRRSGRAVYAGPFRIEAVSVSAERGLRSPDQSGLRLELEIGWEPRLRPIAMAQAAADLKAMCDDGRQTAPTSPEAVFDVEIEPGSHAAEVTLPLQLPAREAKILTSVTGKLTALTPGRIVDLKFDKLAAARETTQEAGGVVVTLDRVVKNQALWEVHMRIRIESLEAGLESHRGWVFQNISYLVDSKGERLDNAGFETTMQTETEAGFAYFFELPEGRQIDDYQWVYRTPASIVSMPVEYKLEEVPLP